MLKRILLAILGIIFVGSLAGFAYYYVQYKKLKEDPAIQARKQTESVLKDLAQDMILPNEPNPMIATVTDKTKLKDDAFFKMAENGDIIVVFPTDLRAVLYRPSTKQIVNIAPVSPDNSAQTTPVTKSAPTVDTTSASSTSDTPVTTKTTKTTKK